MAEALKFEAIEGSPRVPLRSHCAEAENNALGRSLVEGASLQKCAFLCIV